jgi:methionine-rich copper-binding protein CopC
MVSGPVGMRLKRGWLQILATAIAGLGTMGIWLWPSQMVLVDSSPDTQEVVYAILDNEIYMVFNQEIDLGRTKVKVVDAAGNDIVKELAVQGDKVFDKDVILRVTTVSPCPPHQYLPGEYTVTWHAESKTFIGVSGSGSFRFALPDHYLHHTGKPHPCRPAYVPPHPMDGAHH